MMGGDFPDSLPVFDAYVRSFYISKAPITNEQFEAYKPEFERTLGASDHAPAVGVTLHDAVGYCSWYSRISKKNFRLPTEFEWEFACRGGTTDRCFIPPEKASEYMWTKENSQGQLKQADSLRLNPAGLHNMLGNTWEWTSSPFVPYPIDPGAEPNTNFDAEKQLVIRGGSFKTPLNEIGSARRLPALPEHKSNDLGFRIVRSL